MELDFDCKHCGEQNTQQKTCGPIFFECKSCGEFNLIQSVEVLKLEKVGITFKVKAVTNGIN